MKHISILGSTGSIGTSTLDVINNFRHRFKVVALAAKTNVDLIARQIEEFQPRMVSISTVKLRDELYHKVKNKKIEYFYGDEGLEAVAACSEADMVISSLSGAAGLLPTKAAIETGKKVGLANKESLVMGGKLLSQLAQKTGAQIIPIDSEHSAIFQCLLGNRSEDVASLILTASGGPFQHYSPAELEKVTPEQALAHPTWDMGPKVTVDSATLMNKGLEVIEARWLFGLPAEKIEVVIHPQSIVHSMVRFQDGSIISQMSRPDMRIPILFALTYPERWKLELPPLDLVQAKTLTFYAPDTAKFPCLDYAFQVLKRKDGAPIVLNRADEVAVEAFLNREIPFSGIPALIDSVLATYRDQEVVSFSDLVKIDRWAEKTSRELIKQMTKGSDRHAPD
ncbi:1-deoxy-D-xylulose-5-phosphate reductoisomerase [candidate division CSSED10-310 bacterium]|uniref:1-deoxy-D-xylulose 5-phosphate reductoisomerase n=1 Tax=candidate division CSSED10-310 bacterium TaxID=2855610 RepID=A0ABV6YVQ7_UNCC1